MNGPVAQHVAALLQAILETAASTLRGRGEDAHAFLTDADPDTLVSLEVGRDGGNWQRNLIIAIEPAEHGWVVDARITDDEHLTVAQIGRVEAGGDELGEVALAIARAGTGRLLTELGLAVAAA